MNNKDIINKLFELSDKEYALFQSRLTPNVDPSLFIGVRVPVLRNYSKELFKENNYQDFLKELPHKYYDENMLHALLISQIKDYNVCLKEVDKFLPYVDNWAVCDIMSPKCFKKNKEDLLIQIKRWTKSNHSFTIRFGIEMLMSFYLDYDFKKEYLDIVSVVKNDEYYTKMMVAWFFTTALTKQYESSISYIEDGILDTWTHNKTIQKAIESYRITDAQKEYLRTLKK